MAIAVADVEIPPPAQAGADGTRVHGTARADRDAARKLAENLADGQPLKTPDLVKSDVEVRFAKFEVLAKLILQFFLQTPDPVTLDVSRSRSCRTSRPSAPIFVKFADVKLSFTKIVDFSKRFFAKMLNVERCKSVQIL